MNSETALVAHQYRLSQWAQEVREFNNRPANQSALSWCRENNLKPSSFYYHLNQVRKACLDMVPSNEDKAESIPETQSVVPIPQPLIISSSKSRSFSFHFKISINHWCDFYFFRIYSRSLYY